MTYTIKAATCRQTNPFYDPSTASNGGGYFQPEGEAVLVLADGRELKIEYSDASCGDFGDRIWYGVSDGSQSWEWTEDTMSMSDEDMEQQAADTDAVWAAMTAALGLTEGEMVEIIKGARRAICDAAWEEGK